EYERPKRGRSRSNEPYGWLSSRTHRFVPETSQARCSSVVFYLLIRCSPRSTLFPYTTLFRSSCWWWTSCAPTTLRNTASTGPAGDRKSTRLNSSHVAISYAVFCLKKKKRMARHLPRVADSFLAAVVVG